MQLSQNSLYFPVAQHKDLGFSLAVATLHLAFKGPSRSQGLIEEIRCAYIKKRIPHRAERAKCKCVLKQFERREEVLTLSILEEGQW